MPDIDLHLKLCSDDGAILMPVKEKDKFVRFRGIKNTVKQPFVIYSDFEAIIGKRRATHSLWICLKSNKYISKS